MASKEIGNYFQTVIPKADIKAKENDVDYLLNKFVFFVENTDNEVALDFRFYKPLLNHYDATVAFTANIFNELKTKQLVSGSKRNIIHLNLNAINIVKIEKYLPSIKKFMTQLMGMFPEYELTNCYAYNASFIFKMIKQIAVSVYGDKTMKDKIVIVKDDD